MNRSCVTAAIVAMLIALLPPQARAADWQPIEEAWFVIEIDGHKAGWARDAVFDNGVAYRTINEQYLRFQRGPSDATIIQTRMVFEESHNGTPMRIESEMQLSDQPERKVWEFSGDRVIETTERGSRKTTRTIAPPTGTWFMPRAASAFEEARRNAGAREIEYRTVDPGGGLRAVTVLQQFSRDDTHMFNDREIPVGVWDVVTRSESSDLVEEHTVRVSQDHELVSLESSLGAMTITHTRATRNEAQRAFGEGPELLVSAFVKPDRRIPGAHRSSTATYRVTYTGSDTIVWPSAGAQRVADDAEGRGVLLEVNTFEPSTATADELQNENLLAASAVCDSADEMIIALAEVATERAGDDLSERATALHAAVFEYIEAKDFSTAFGSASETIRSRSGDCSEHAVLLCALLRADGIPARIASGLVYVDAFADQRNVFGWHMWTQALIDGKWVDLDATLDRPFHAAHILTGVSDLANGTLGDEFARMSRLMGQLEIEVLDVGYERRPQDDSRPSR